MFRVMVAGVVAVTGIIVVAPNAWAEDRDSTKWAGYASAVDEGSFDTIRARWVVPTIRCEPDEIQTEVAVWIGLDGVSGGRVEQVGTSSECDGSPDGTPKYYAWVEMYPDPAHLLNIEVRAGDTISAKVKLREGQFGFTVRNETLGTQDSDTLPCDAPGLSAEAVVEAPPSQRLPQFDPITFRDVRVDGDPLSETEPDRLTLVKEGEPRVVRAEPGQITDGTEFSVVYVSH